jgi:hypothetical protein
LLAISSIKIFNSSIESILSVFFNI